MRRRQVVVTGATGGVGSYALQIAACERRAHAIAIADDPSAAADLIGLGAASVVSYRSETFAEELLEATQAARPTWSSTPWAPGCSVRC